MTTLARRNAPKLCVALALVALCLFIAPELLPGGRGRTARAASATFVVTNTNDVGAGSLRQAILDANSNPGLDTITFNVGSGGAVSFTNVPPLPAVTDAAIIDGTTQPGYAGTPIVVIDGSLGNSGTGLILEGGSTVRGLVVSGWNGFGLILRGAGGNRVENCYIGTDVTGTVANRNGSGGIFVPSSNNVIGGTEPAARNVISGNSLAGVSISRFCCTGDESPITGNVVQGNYIGTNAAGTAALPNQREGIRLNSFNSNVPVTANVVGGASPGARNVVSGNGFEGIVFDGALVSGNTIQGNYVGTDAGGSYAIPNVSHGVVSAGASSVVNGNLISGNGVNGSGLAGGNGLSVNGTGHVVRGNFVGTNADGTSAIPNLLDGITAAGTNITVGGVAPGERNVVAFNGTAGVLVGPNSTTRVSVRGNSVFSNGRFRDPNFPGPGIDLFPRAVTANDAGDADTGANNLQNFPVINSVGFGPSGTTVAGTLNSTPATNFTIDFYANSTCGFHGFGEGARHIGSLVVTTDAAGDGAFNSTLPAVLAAGQVVTATATDPTGNTSELSQCDTSAAAVGSVGFTSMFLNVNEGAGVASVVVQRTGGTTGTLTVNYSATGETATAGADFTPVSGTLTFADGETTKMFTVPILEDNIGNEFSGPFGGETVRLALTAVGDPDTLDSRSAVLLVIEENDARPAVSVADFSAAEGDFNNSTFNFQVTLSRPSALPVSFVYNTANGTAQAGFDFFSPSGMPPFSVTFNPGETTKTVAITVIGDTAVEPDESFTLNLSNVTNANVADGSATGTILNDDAAPTVSLSIDDISVTEGTGVITDAVFTVSLSAPTDKTVRFAVTSFGVTAIPGEDFQSIGMTVTLEPGETSKQVVVKVFGDNIAESNETFRVELTSVTNANVADMVGVCTIIDDEPRPTLSINDVTVTEGDEGQRQATFVVTVSARSTQGTSFSFTLAPGTATEFEDYSPVSGGALIPPDLTSTTINVPINGDTVDEPDETFFVNLSNATNVTIADAQGVATIIDDEDDTGTPTIQFTMREHVASEGAGQVGVVVTRSGDSSAPVTVEFFTETQNAIFAASDRGDYTAANGRLRFAAGETSKSFNVFITDDLFVEPEERLVMHLVNPTGGAVLGNPARGVIVIKDNDAAPSSANPSDDSAFFVRQHYRDFLGRDPDQAGLDFWVGGIESCGTDQSCREIKRVDTSAAFFLSIEFQETGFLVYRTHKAAFGDINPPTVPVPVRLPQFLFDSRLIGENVIVGTAGWPEQLEANKVAYFNEFVTRPSFASLYPQTLTAAEFVDALFARAEVQPTQAERNAAIDAFNTSGRAAALRKVAESETLKRAETNKAFVLMQYFGYLRRNPDDPQDTNFDGYLFWLTKLNQFNGNYVEAEMVRAFITSIEYRQRFGQ